MYKYNFNDTPTFYIDTKNLTCYKRESNKMEKITKIECFNDNKIVKTFLGKDIKNILSNLKDFDKIKIYTNLTNSLSINKSDKIITFEDEYRDDKLKYILVDYNKDNFGMECHTTCVVINKNHCRRYNDLEFRAAGTGIKNLMYADTSFFPSRFNKNECVCDALINESGIFIKDEAFINKVLDMFKEWLTLNGKSFCKDFKFKNNVYLDAFIRCPENPQKIILNNLIEGIQDLKNCSVEDFEKECAKFFNLEYNDFFKDLFKNDITNLCVLHVLNKNGFTNLEEIYKKIKDKNIDSILDSKRDFKHFDRFIQTYLKYRSKEEFIDILNDEIDPEIFKIISTLDSINKLDANFIDRLSYNRFNTFAKDIAQNYCNEEIYKILYDIVSRYKPIYEDLKERLFFIDSKEDVENIDIISKCINEDVRYRRIAADIDYGRCLLLHLNHKLGDFIGLPSTTGSFLGGSLNSVCFDGGYVYGYPRSCRNILEELDQKNYEKYKEKKATKSKDTEIDDLLPLF